MTLSCVNSPPLAAAPLPSPGGPRRARGGNAGASALAIALTALLCAVPAGAHDFWLEPETFAPAAPGALAVRFGLGHIDDASSWYAPPHRVVSFRSYSDAAVVDHQGSLAGRDPFAPAALTLGAPGSHVIALESHRSFSRLGAEKFSRYVADEGITPLREHRLAEGRLTADGTEVYARCAKAIVTVGGEPTGAATRRLGMTLEITPLQDPGAVERGDAFRFAVHYRGVPLEGATVHVVRLDTAAEKPAVVTGSSGEAGFTSPGGGGAFMLHTVWAEPAPNLLEDADYATTFASLTFAFPRSEAGVSAAPR